MRLTCGMAHKGDGGIHGVVRDGLCLGCGACAAVSDGISIFWTADGFLEATLPANLRPDQESRAAAVCPFSESAIDEETLAKSYYQPECAHRSDELGWFRSTYVGYVVDSAVRARASSGGLARWVLCALLEQHLVDGCAHVRRADPRRNSGGGLYEYVLSTEPVDVLRTATSAYYPVHLAEVLRQITDRPGRYVITGVPCFIKAIRLLQRKHSVLRERVAFTVGLFCGHMKSRHYAEMLAWQVGIRPEQLAAVEFRDKTAGVTAKQKGFVAASCQRQANPVITSQLFGGDYSLGFFQHRACDYCDDVAAETADVAIGDAWLPEYIQDARGTSLVVTRNPVIDDLLQRGAKDGAIRLELIEPLRVLESQAGAFRHRREGLAYRLYLDERTGRWHPPKRVAARCGGVSRLRRRIYQTRIALRQESTEAFREAKALGDFSAFQARMEPLVRIYRSLYRPSLIHRLARRIRRWVSKVAAIGR